MRTRFTILFIILLSCVPTLSAMGLRSFVALPVDKGGSVLRLQNIYTNNTDTLITSLAYGVDLKQTLLLGLPYRINPSGDDKQGDLSVLYRYILIQDDVFEGTERFALLGGAIVPAEADRDYALQLGFVYTYFQDRHEIDIDVLYKNGFADKLDSANYDISWQYRLLPNVRDDWGITQELNSVLELNGRWNEHNTMTHQLTLGLQWIHASWVLELGFVKDLNNAKKETYIVSTRFHF